MSCIQGASCRRHVPLYFKSVRGVSGGFKALPLLRHVARSDIPHTHLLRWVPCRLRGPSSGPLAARSWFFARLLAAPAFLVRSPVESVALALRVLAECTVGLPRYSQGRRSIAFFPTGARQSPRSSSLWWRDLNGGLRVLLHLRRLPHRSQRGSGLPCRRSPPTLLTAHLACYFGVGTVASRVLHIPIPPHRVGPGGLPAFRSRFRFYCRVSAGPPFCPAALLQRQNR
ncbi:hypothetical protein NDU88_002052 [Pleurodeles waltl]|uniref:Uncharacterized protein n=1 Tax=Pleurodeles waltl TaxID=8319 RepID=A0AAV7RC62_PLEWA|nr:hypothetical protein NDU88_002052 [Pleurodeles waltl]